MNRDNSTILQVWILKGVYVLALRLIGCSVVERVIERGLTICEDCWCYIPIWLSQLQREMHHTGRVWNAMTCSASKDKHRHCQSG